MTSITDPATALVRPFAGIRPAERFAEDVAAPPYDVLNDDEARTYATGKPWSFLHISKPVIDCPTGTHPYDDEVYQQGRQNLDSMFEQGVLIRDTAPCYYVYRLKMADHVQTGIVVAASVNAYNDGRIKRHEFTQPKKEDDRVRQIDVLDAQTGPVIVTHKPHSQLGVMLDAVCQQHPPIYSVMLNNTVKHELWPIDDAVLLQQINGCFGDGPGRIGTLYIADGHHRSAAAARVAQSRREANPAHRGDEPYNYFLAVAFPSDQVMILDYNRLVRDLGSFDAPGLIEKISQKFNVQRSPAPVKPDGFDEFGMYIDHSWYRLRINANLLANDDPVARLSVSLLHDHLIEPLLGIEDSRKDPRIDFVGGIRGLAELQRRVDSQEMAVAFSLFPTPLNDLMAVADRNQVMPTKSTWFEPKLADGLVSHSIA